MTKNVTFILLLLATVFSCSKKTDTLYRLLEPQQTGIDFQNDVMEDEYLNILSNEYIYNGAGVGIGDFNNDKLMDIFFCGSQVTNRLYLNMGNLKFDDVSLTARISGRTLWSTGVAVVDINQDGWQDIYVCTSNHLQSEMRTNQLYINEGLNEQGIPAFSEQSSKYGVGDEGYSTHAAFFDYDNDGDLDLYVLTNFLDTPTPNKYRPKKQDGSAESNDRLYRNNGDNTFSNVTKAAGIVYEGYGLGVSIVDINMDGWRDIYVSNDYLTNDLLYINNGDGTFTNRIDSYIKHQTHSAMGHDIADINNDGLVDIFTLDMLPEDNQGMKKMHGVTRFENEQFNRDFGYQRQYKRNMLQLNNGVDALGNHTFSEIGLYAGVYATEWSWTALLADYDNDGFRDLFVTNGYPRDVTDLDYAVSGMSRGRGLSNEEQMMMIPVRSMSNYMYQNNGDLTFSNQTKAWGLDKESFANGAAYVDLDNDGDLDLVTNNYNEPAMVYENTLYVKGRDIENHYLRIFLDQAKGVGINGARVYLYSDGELKYADHNIFRGYRSTVEPTIHFGLGEQTSIDSLLIIWPDMQMQKVYDIQVDQTLEIAYQPDGNALTTRVDLASRQKGLLFSDEASQYGLDFRHQEKVFDDFSLQETLPYQFSQEGPPLASEDIDGDGLTDLVIGGSYGQPGTIFFQNELGFEGVVLGQEHSQFEDTDLLLFDVENDGDLDIYIASGSQEGGQNPANYQDRLYLNDGVGNFQVTPNALPGMPVSTSCVRVADFDADGDLDLFVGGRLLPGKYPEKASSFLLRNDFDDDDIKFTDITNTTCQDLIDYGLVTDAIWEDFNNDELVDLVLVGEYLPISIFENTGSGFSNITETSGIRDKLGWWRSIESGDFDNDGDVDFIVGNEGLNSWFRASAEEPITSYSYDFDNNGRHDVILCQFLLSKDGTRKAFPVHFKSDLAKQLEMMRQKFPTYKEYSEATMEDLFPEEELNRANRFQANWMASSYIENLGNGKFEISELPTRAQLAPINAMMARDLNGDGNLDLLVAGNNFSNGVFWGPMDAMNGLVMLGNGQGGFTCHDYPETDFYVPGDGRSIVSLGTFNRKELIVVSQNQDSIRIFELIRN